MKNFFTKKYRIITIIFSFLFLIGVGAQTMIYIPANTLFVPGVNISPIGVLAREATHTRVQYRIDFAQNTNTDFNKELNVMIPKYAENISFILYGTEDGFGSEPYQTSIPLNICEGCQPYFIPTRQDLDGINTDAGLDNIIRKLSDTEIADISNQWKYYDIYSTLTLKTGHPASILVSFDVPKNIDATYIPIRSYMCNGPCYWNGQMYASDMPIPTNISSTLDEEYFPNIARGDFDEHGLYLNQAQCVVTRNFSDWWKIGSDIDHSESYNFHEDLCDQAVVDISEV